MIDFANPLRDRSKVSDYSFVVLRDVMQAAGVQKIIITSTARTPLEQARIMYDNLTRYGVVHQKALYGYHGDMVIDEYVRLSKDTQRPRDAIIGGMADKIMAMGPEKISNHIADLNVLNVVDIAPSSIPSALHASFVNAIQADTRVSKCHVPPRDPAFHLEIPQQVSP